MGPCKQIRGDVAIRLPGWPANGPLGPEWPPILAGLGAIAGHVWSVFARFRGGKGVATTAGVLLALSPAAFGVFVAVFVATVAVTRYISLGSMLGALAFALTLGLTHGWRHPLAISYPWSILSSSAGMSSGAC